MRGPALALCAVALLRLLPPGWGDRAHAKTQPQMPAALAHGSRASTGGPASLPMQVMVKPAPARLGQKLLWRGVVFSDPGVQIRFDRPEAGGAFSWGTPRAGRSRATAARAYGQDSSWIEIPVQVFATGPVSIPGPGIHIDLTRAGGGRFESRLPTAHLLILPMLTAADSAAQLRPVRGPLGAPWWERISWRLVAGVLLLLALVIAAVVWIRRRLRKPKVVAPVVAAAPRVVRDPAAEALAALARLRAEQLPALGRFGDHALALSRILHRYLEATVGTPRPGDTSPELLARLRGSALSEADLERLEGLLGLWDRVKFARAPLGVEEAVRTEDAVENLVRRRETPREVA